MRNDQLSLQGFKAVAACSQLQPFIDNFWTIKRTAPFLDTSHLLHSDCASGMIFNFSDQIEINNIALKNAGYICTSFIKSQQLKLTGNINTLGIRFKPAATRLFTNLHAKDTKELITTDINYTLTSQLYEQLAQSSNFVHQVRFLELFFLNSINQHNHNLNSLEQTLSQHLLKVIDAHYGHITLSELSENTGLHTKKIERIFSQYIGINFRQSCQITKSKHAMNTIKSQPTKPLSEIAVDLNYFDQAHFTKQFKAVIGVTPARYHNQKHGQLSVTKK